MRDEEMLVDSEYIMDLLHFDKLRRIFYTYLGA